jgi:phage gp36-like protein
MAYTTVSAITGSAWSVSGEVSAAIVGRAIGIGDAIIDSYCDRRYTVPFSSVPTLISELAIPIARYWGQIYAGSDVTHLHEPDKEAYACCIKILETIRDGKMDVPGAIEKSADDKVWSSTQDYAPIHDVDDEMYHGVDEDRLDDIENDRE